MCQWVQYQQGLLFFFLGYVYRTCQKWALKKLIKGNVEFIKQRKTQPLLCQELVEGKLVAGCVPIYEKTEKCGTNTIGEKLKLRENIEYSQRVCMLKQVLHLHHRWLYPLPYLCLPTVPSNLRYLMCHPIILSSRMLELSPIWNHSSHFISHFLQTLDFKSFHVSLYKNYCLFSE